MNEETNKNINMYTVLYNKTVNKIAAFERILIWFM
jgi:hypothetical protein